MKLKSLNKYIGLLILIISFEPLYAEEEIDIWNKEKNIKSESLKNKNQDALTITNSKILSAPNINNNIEIENAILDSSKNLEIFGVYEPADSDLDLNMWSQTKAENLRSIMTRIKKINLSRTATSLFEKTFLTFSYPPQGMDDDEFTDLKINWVIEKKKSELVEKILKQNNSFHNKKKIIQYLVDENISKANIKKGCEKVNFLDKNIKDAYLEKFKIYCLIFNNKKNEAQLLYDILKEQNQSDKFFDDKINFLLGITTKTNDKIKENNLLNFYLSSITINDFKFEPKKNTKKIIWEYLDAANLIQLNDIDNKDKLKNLEIAASLDQFDKEKIFIIYKKIPFDLNSLINAENIYQSLNNSDSRALIYQKFLLSDNNENKIKFLFLLKDLFDKDNLSNAYFKFLSDKLKEINLEDVPESYQEVVQSNIISGKDFKLGKIKYNDKILHRSKLIKYYTENANFKKIQKDLDKVYKKIKKDKKYFFSAKDLTLVESIANDGFKIPKDLDYKEISKKYDVPVSLLQLAKNNEPAFLTMKIVEIIGEDEIYDLDPETIYFITHLLNQANLKKIRNKILISALPLRS